MCLGINWGYGELVSDGFRGRFKGVEGHDPCGSRPSRGKVSVKIRSAKKWSFPQKISPAAFRSLNTALIREGSITTIPPITIMHPCNWFSITIISPCNRHDYNYNYDYDYIASPKLINDFVTAFTKSELIKKKKMR